jgi:hypothetical protein
MRHSRPQERSRVPRSQIRLRAFEVLRDRQDRAFDLDTIEAFGKAVEDLSDYEITIAKEATALNPTQRWGISRT